MMLTLTRASSHAPCAPTCCSRVESLDELCYMVRETGYRTVGRKGLQKVAALIGTGEKEVRDAAIDVMEALWVQLSREKEAVFTMIDDKGLPDKTRALLEARFAHNKVTPKARPGAGMCAAACVGPSAATCRACVLPPVCCRCVGPTAATCRACVLRLLLPPV
jgi:hypothetical protein